jgi:hypothetical protein
VKAIDETRKEDMTSATRDTSWPAEDRNRMNKVIRTWIPARGPSGTDERGKPAYGNERETVIVRGED